jgi:hypothetical protein
MNSVQKRALRDLRKLNKPFLAAHIQKTRYGIFRRYVHVFGSFHILVDGNKFRPDKLVAGFNDPKQVQRYLDRHPLTELYVVDRLHDNQRT